MVRKPDPVMVRIEVCQTLFELELRMVYASPQPTVTRTPNYPPFRVEFSPFEFEVTATQEVASCITETMFSRKAIIVEWRDSSEMVWVIEGQVLGFGLSSDGLLHCRLASDHVSFPVTNSFPNTSPPTTSPAPTQP